MTEQDISFQYIQGGLVIVNEDYIAGTSAECLQTQRAGSRKEIQNICLLDSLSKDGKQCLPGAIRSRSDG